MKAEIKNILQTILFLFCLLPVWVDAANYTVSTRTSTVDGDTFCGGSACTSADRIIINGGARGNLLFKDFDGRGKYITITNENTNPDAKVVITSGTVGPTWAGLELRDCKYVDLRGDNDADLAYGIKVIYDGTPTMSAVVRVRQKSDHIKISYLEIDDTVSTATGLMVLDNALSASWIFDTFEIHHNYIHDIGYAGMYLGQNDPYILDNPYIANFSVHDNLLEDLGAYGITTKGVHRNSGVCSIYNNIIRGSSGGQSTGLVTTKGDDFKFGIGFSRYDGTSYANVYHNWIEKTVGAGINGRGLGHNIYDNKIFGCGTGDDSTYGHGIVLKISSKDINVYNNIIIQPKRYGIYAVDGAISVTLSRNLIGDAVLGEWHEMQADDVTEKTGDDANIYHADVADFDFKTWSDDGNYSNDNFSISILKPPQKLRKLD